MLHSDLQRKEISKYKTIGMMIGFLTSHFSLVFLAVAFSSR